MDIGLCLGSSLTVIEYFRMYKHKPTSLSSDCAYAVHKIHEGVLLMLWITLKGQLRGLDTDGSFSHSFTR